MFFFHNKKVTIEENFNINFNANTDPKQGRAFVDIIGEYDITVTFQSSSTAFIIYCLTRQIIRYASYLPTKFAVDFVK